MTTDPAALTRPAPVAEVRLVLPLPPSANRYWRVYRGRAVLSEAAQAYAGEVLAALTLAYPAGRPRLSPPLELHLTLLVRSVGRLDADNGIKVIGDCFKRLLDIDDKHTIDIVIRKRLLGKSVRKHGPVRCLVTMRGVPAERAIWTGEGA